jgi:hypothetical protein
MIVDGATNAPHARVSRRNFLLAGSAVVASAVLFDSRHAPAPTGLESLAASGGERISVGYVEGSETFRTLAQAGDAGSSRVVPASGVRAVGGTLVRRPVTLTVLGLTSAPGAHAAFERVFLDTLISSPDARDAGATIPFYAWSLRRGTSPARSGASRVTVAPESGKRFGVRLDVTAAGADRPRREATTVFTSGTERSLPKLRPGLYLLGLAPAVWDAARTLPDADATEWDDLASMVLRIEAVKAE